MTGTAKCLECKAQSQNNFGLVLCIKGIGSVCQLNCFHFPGLNETNTNPSVDRDQVHEQTLLFFVPLQIYILTHVTSHVIRLFHCY